MSRISALSIKSQYICEEIKSKNMAKNKGVNRFKVVLAEKQCTNKHNYLTHEYCANYHPDEPGEVAMGDIVDFTTKAENIANLPDFDLVTGGFPCQTFSMMGKQAGVAESSLYKQAGNAVSVNTVYTILYFLITNNIIHE